MKKPPECSFFRLIVQTRIHSTESLDKLKDALRNVMQHSTMNIEKQTLLVGRSERIDSLITIYEQVRARQSVSVLRRMLINHMDRSTTWFLLNKQAAAAGVVALVDTDSESPLGAIRVHIQSDTLQQIIEWLA
jgi:predicted RNA binding protein with dsRBD fold (UPF0201 family)